MRGRWVFLVANCTARGAEGSHMLFPLWQEWWAKKVSLGPGCDIDQTKPPLTSSVRPVLGVLVFFVLLLLFCFVLLLLFCFHHVLKLPLLDFWTSTETFSSVGDGLIHVWIHPSIFAGKRIENSHYATLSLLLNVRLLRLLKMWISQNGFKSLLFFFFLLGIFHSYSFHVSLSLIVIIFITFTEHLLLPFTGTNIVGLHRSRSCWFCWILLLEIKSIFPETFVLILFS